MGAMSSKTALYHRSAINGASVAAHPERILELLRRTATQGLDPTDRGALGQFLTPWPVARFMASLFDATDCPDARVLDAGAGVGSLAAAFVDRWCSASGKNATISLTTVEVDQRMHPHLEATLSLSKDYAAQRNHPVSASLIREDFLLRGTEWLLPLSGSNERFTHAILNPPYKKINNDSTHRRLLREVGIETVNLYTAFVAVAVALLADHGQLVAIIPRSWCNGSYYRPFRLWMERHAALTHIHLFESRKKAFKDDDVLQENVIVRWVRSAPQRNVLVSASSDATFSDFHQIEHPYEVIVHPGDSQHYVHIPLSAPEAPSSKLFSNTLPEIGIDASTGPVVDFRLKSHLRQDQTDETVSLLYPQHFQTGELVYPANCRKPNAVSLNNETHRWLYPKGWYVITKRFTAKEERRRVVAHVVDPAKLPGEHIGFENHINVYHANHAGLQPDLAYGLALFLNSTIVDDNFRLFSGHTQVNVTDLRRMRYPSRDQLIRFGRWSRSQDNLNQSKIDEFIQRHT